MLSPRGLSYRTNTISCVFVSPANSAHFHSLSTKTGVLRPSALKIALLSPIFLSTDDPRVTGSLVRRFSLPDKGNAEEIEAYARNGALEVEIVRQTRLQPRTIQVKPA
jgi:hypothetical protein